MLFIITLTLFPCFDIYLGILVGSRDVNVIMEGLLYCPSLCCYFIPSFLLGRSLVLCGSLVQKTVCLNMVRNGVCCFSAIVDLCALLASFLESGEQGGRHIYSVHNSEYGVGGLPCAHNFHVECIGRCWSWVFPNLDRSALSNIQTDTECGHNNSICEKPDRSALSIFRGFLILLSLTIKNPI